MASITITMSQPSKLAIDLASYLCNHPDYSMRFNLINSNDLAQLIQEFLDDRS